MTNEPSLSPDDPLLTAYALGELDGPERAAVEAALAANPALRSVVDGIRATAEQLEAALAVEPAPAPSAVVVPARPQARLVRFPVAYYIIGGLAAASFAVMVLRDEPPIREVSRRAKSNYVQLEMDKPSGGDTAVDTTPGQGAKAAEQGAVVFNAPKLEIAPLTLPSSRPLPAAQAPAPAPAEPLPAANLAARAGPPMAAASAPVLAGGVARARTLAVSGAGGRADSIPETAGSRLAPGGAEANMRFSYPSNAAVSKDGGRGPQAFTAESYAFRQDNAFIAVANEPLSTFSIDADTAGYSNVRRFLRNGERPPRDAVRIEEMVNYFPYRYAPPTDNTPFAASLEVAAAPWEPKHRLVRIGLKGREVGRAARPAANLVFLLDVSASMDAPNKLPLVKESLRLLVEKLRPDDRVGIVVYAGATGLALPSTPVAKSTEILAALDELRPGGGTNGGMGIQLAYDIAKANFVPGGVNRVILCTDGDFNVGVTTQGDLLRLIEEKARSNVFLTVLGFGMGNLKDSTLELLADKGNGSYGYIDSRREAEKLLVEQAGGTLVTIAKDVKVQVEFNPAQVKAYRLIGYENRLLKKEDFNNDRIDAGEVGAGHTVTALYELIPAGADDKIPAISVDALKYQKTAPAASGQASGSDNNPQSAARNPQSQELLTVKIRYKEPTADDSRRLEFPLTDQGADFAAASDDFRFAAAVAAFGLALREDTVKGSLLADSVRWAESGRSDDPGGYRAEFLGLVRQAQEITR